MQISFAVTAKLISAFVFATRIAQSLYFLNPKFQASSHFLWLYSLVFVGPGQNPRKPVFSQRGSIVTGGSVIAHLLSGPGLSTIYRFAYANKNISLMLLWILFALEVSYYGPQHEKTPLLTKLWYNKKNAFLQTSTKCFHTNLLLCQTMSPTLHGSIIFKEYFLYTYKECYLKMW